MKRKALKTLLLALVLTGIFSVSAFAASIGGASVDVPDLNFRREANLNSSIYMTVPKDTLVVVAEKVDDNWYKVVHRGAVGYMSAEFLTFSESLDGDFGSGVIRGTGVRMRAEPNLNSSIVATYDNGTIMAVQGVYGNWYKVSIGETTGFIHSDYFALNGGTSDLYGTANANSDIGQQIVDTAMQYMGVSYVWAGASPSGFDCSGFVYYVYKENGYSISRTAASIYGEGVYVEKSDLQIGDAVCFSSSSQSIGHVGIYIGDGQFIHSSSGAGSVIISDLDSAYYTRNYVGARRLV